MNITQIETLVQELAQKSPQAPADFLYDLLAAFDTPKATLSRLRQGNLNLSKNADEVIWKKKLFFKTATPADDLHDLFHAVKNAPAAKKHEPRFLLVANETTLLALDTKTSDTLDTPIADLPQCFDFFLPIAGMEKAAYQSENPADVKAAEKMARLYDQITKENPADTPEATHALNVFLSRLLFCFFAEDTGIFQKSQFTLALESHTQPEGDDLGPYLDRLFEVLNTPETDRAGLPNYLAAFPYVNGGLFRGQYAAPRFSRRSRQTLLDCGALDWAAINPDIFGSMIQAVVHPDQRGGLGMHYTSVPNIMKVIRPLFLDELLDEFQAAKGDPKRLRKLHRRICRIRVFDPACGSGNFLIIAYKELRLLEMLLFRELGEFLFSDISLSNFYGIELDDFAQEVATLSLWLAEHQMNQAFLAEFGRTKPALPLLASGNITHGNATRLDWKTVCPMPEDGGEVFVLGNPPYFGARVQSEEQKTDMALVFYNVEGYNNLDYIACWFLKASDFILKHQAQCAFVTTNSICQGEQVSLLWPHILKTKLEIGFTYQSFKWANSAKYNAGVTVTIIGLRNHANQPKYIYQPDHKQAVTNINAYLVNARNVYIKKRTKPIADLPEMSFGSMPNDGGHLILNTEEYQDLLSKYPSASKFVKFLKGSKEFINDIPRWCLWIEDQDLEEALAVDFIGQRIDKLKKLRSASDRKATNNLAEKAHRFGEIRFKPTTSIIIPRHSSENRDYIPMGFLGPETVISDAANAIYDADPWIFAILTSRLHMTWVATVGGRIKTDYRYSAQLCYNTFPMPPLTPAQKTTLQQHVYQVLAEREQHPERTLAELYDPEKMPEGLRAAHRALDAAVERCYRAEPFGSDEERLEYLFRLYEKMLQEEREKGTLFAGSGKGKKR